jgi:hypothetical protein
MIEKKALLVRLRKNFVLGRTVRRKNVASRDIEIVALIQLEIHLDVQLDILLDIHVHII